LVCSEYCSTVQNELVHLNCIFFNQEFLVTELRKILTPCFYFFWHVWCISHTFWYYIINLNPWTKEIHMEQTIFFSWSYNISILHFTALILYVLAIEARRVLMIYSKCMFLVLHKRKLIGTLLIRSEVCLILICITLFKWAILQCPIFFEASNIILVNLLWLQEWEVFRNGIGSEGGAVSQGNKGIFCLMIQILKKEWMETNISWKEKGD
jgi:hypothetical protein